MNCCMCGLPFTNDYPEYNPGAEYHEASACIRGLRTELAKMREQTTPRQYSDSTPAQGDTYLYWSPEHCRWFKAYWPERRYSERGEVWLPMPPAPKDVDHA